MNSYLKGLLCCLLATVSWGGMFPVMTHALTYIDPFNFTIFAMGLRVLPLHCYCYFVKAKIHSG